MEKHIEVIGIDHGWSKMKTATQIFTTGVKEITTEPAFYDDVVELDGKYYKVGGKRLEVRDTKVENDLTDITITKKLITEENDHAIKTRIPGTWGENARYDWISKDKAMEIHEGKTILTFLDRNKEYKIYSEDNRVVGTMKGRELYDGHYDRVSAEVRKRYADMEWKAKEQERMRKKKPAPKKAPAPQKR